MEPTQPISSRLSTPGGESLALFDWPLDPGLRSRGVVLLVHGLGEHALRYDALARAFNAWGFSVRAFDQYGHGQSSGPRGGLPSDTRLLDDLAAVIDRTRHQWGAQAPLLLLGHSMGGLVAASLVAQGLRPVDALVLSSPALDPGLNPVQKLLLAVLPGILPNLRVGNGLNTRWLSHDPAVVAAYCADPLVHDRISGRLGRFIAQGGPATVARAAQWQVPTLLLYAGADRLVNPAGSQAFAASAPATTLRAHCFEALYHEIFNEQEPDRTEVLARLKDWLDTRFAL